MEITNASPIFKRKFDKNTVIIFKNPATLNWLIEIKDEWYTNRGIVYKIGEKPDWNNQLIAMDNDFGMTKSIQMWIYNVIEKRIPKLKSEVIIR